jgi:AraC-like DNA-binding protein
MARIDPCNAARHWRDADNPGLALLAADFTTHAYPPHSHEAFVVAVTEAGGSIIRSRGEESEADAATLHVFNPAEPHAGWMGKSRRWRYRGFYLERRAIAALTGQLGVDALPYFTRNAFADADLIASFLALHRALEAGRGAPRESELLVASFGRLFQRHGASPLRAPAAPRDERLLRRAIEFMRAHQVRPLRLEEMAKAVALTPFQLIGLFRRGTGLTPHAYLTQIRLFAACRMLKRGGAIAEIASTCGFYDQSALTRHFKRCYGITPLQFARAVGK